MKSVAGTLAAPFPYFGGKSLACETVWAALGDPENYVEPFAGSAAMLLGRPNVGKVETINDADGFVANFWRAVSLDAAEVARHVDWPTNEADLIARHSWLVRNAQGLLQRLEADPDYYDAKVAGWWCWGACNWIGSGWCSGTGPWQHDGEKLVDARKLPHLGNAGRGVNRKLPHLGNAGRGVNRQLPHLGNAGRGVNRQLPHLGNAGRGVNRKLPHLGDAGRGVNRQLPHLGNAGRGVNRKLPHLGNAGRGVNRQLPHLSAGRGVNRKLPHLGDAGRGVNRKLPHLGDAGRGVNRQLPHLGNAGQGRSAYIYEWFAALMDRTRGVRVAVGDWQRVLTDSVTVRHGLTGVFLDPPYTKGSMDYAAGGVGGELADKARAWCAKNGHDKRLRIVLCGHAGEHDGLLQAGWHTRAWTARKGYASTDEAVENSASETIWCSPHCVPERQKQEALF